MKIWLVSRLRADARERHKRRRNCKKEGLMTEIGEKLKE